MNTQSQQQRRDKVAQLALNGTLSDAQLIQLAEDADVQETIEEIRSGRNPIIVYEKSLASAVQAGDTLIEWAKANPQPPDSENGRLIHYLALSIQRLCMAYEQLVVAAYAKLFRSEVN